MDGQVLFSAIRNDNREYEWFSVLLGVSLAFSKLRVEMGESVSIVQAPETKVEAVTCRFLDIWAVFIHWGI